MANIQAKPSVGNRLLGWIKNHKVKASFWVIGIGLVLYLAGSWVALQVRIHNERRDYMQAQRLVNSLLDDVTLPGSPSVKRFSDCSYSNGGGVFAAKILGCETGMSVVYAPTSKTDALAVRDLFRQEMVKQGLKFHENPGGMGEHDLSVDVFNLGKITCGLSASYYDEHVPPQEREASIPDMGSASIASISCSGSALTEYFPVTKN